MAEASLRAPARRRVLRRAHPHGDARSSSATPTRCRSRKLDKIVLNMGIGEAVADSKKPSVAACGPGAIAGQKPVATKARNSIAGFKLREGMVIGAKVTLRKDRMYEFLDRLITIALPRVKDFRGLKPTCFDGRGNYAMGLKEHIVFPEINYDQIDQMWGMDIIVCTTAKTDDEARALLKEFKFPFRAVTAARKGKIEMAKKSAVETNNRRRKLVKQYAAKRAALKAIANEREPAAGRALRAPPEAGRAAAQLGQDPHPQPLRSDGPSARLSIAS